MTGVSTRKELIGSKPEGRPRFILGDLSELLSAYVAPKQTKRGFSCASAEVELLGNRVMVTHGDPKSLDALKASCLTIWNCGTPIHLLDVESALYE
jgi:hypothetical protein